MRKFLVLALSFVVFAVLLPMSAEAQSCKRKGVGSRGTNYGVAGYRTYNRRNNSRYAARGYSSQRRPSVYRRHRNLINIGIGAGSGAVIGGLAGGRRGAGWGALAGAGAAAVYTYKINPKQRRYYRR